MAQLKILQLSKFYPPTMGGIELVAKMISKAHSDIGDQINVLSFGSGDKDYSGEFGENIHQLNSDIVFLSAPINYSFFFKFKKYINECKPDKIYVHLPNPYMHQMLWLFKGILKKQNIKISAVYHSDIVNHKFFGPMYDLLFNMTSAFYDEIICSSNKLWESSKVLQQRDLKLKKIIPFCIDGENPFVERKNFSGNLLAIGRFVPYKGFAFLIDAIRDTDYHLNIIGDGPLKDSLSQNLPENVKLLGRISDEEKRKLMQESDLLVLSSINRAEAFGMIIVEAFECGMPVIASNINSGVTFLAKDNERGKVFEILSKKSLLCALNVFNKNPELLSKYSNNSRKFFEENLTYEKFKENIYLLDH